MSIHRIHKKQIALLITAVFFSSPLSHAAFFFYFPPPGQGPRTGEHTSEIPSPFQIVYRLFLVKKKKKHHLKTKNKNF